MHPLLPTMLLLGTITNAKTRVEIVGLVVRAFDADGAMRTALGQGITDSMGSYRVNFDSAAFRNTKAERGGPDLVIEVFDETGEVELGRSIRYNNSATATVIDLAIDVPTLCVYGTVTNSTKHRRYKFHCHCLGP